MCSLQDVEKAQACLNRKDRKGERVKLVEVNCSQETTRESPSDDDYDRSFSLFGLVESILSVVANGLSTVMSSIVGTEKKNLRSSARRVNYRNYHLIRVFPNTENHVADMRDLRDFEPEDIKFWSFPSPNRYVIFLL